ncbi:MAG: hypothetical protein KF878_24555 [Planctomycetes bacterium]|nr:hypothetical protein [Planctomycetota bacterium]
MTHDPQQDLARRLDRLEADVHQAHAAARRWRAAAGGVVALGMSLVLMGQTPDRTVRGTSFVLEDASGRRRAALQTVNGRPHLTLFDSQGKPRIDLSASDDGRGTLGLLDGDGKVRAALGVTPTGQGSLVFRGPSDETRAALTIGNEGAPGLVLNDQAGKTLVSLGVARGIPTVGLRDGVGELRALLAVDGQGVLRFYDAAGKRTHQLPE